jgi:hypothetical protein
VVDERRGARHNIYVLGGILMRGSVRVGVLAMSLVCSFAFMTASASAITPELLDKQGGVLLRDVAKEPKNQPDALAFVNSGTMRIAIAGEGTIECTEINFGTTVVKNPGITLALPFGVFEGDSCSLAGVGNVPTYFATTAEGAVGNPATNTVASITVTEPVAGEWVATLHDLQFSQNVGGKFCSYNFDRVEGRVINSTGPFVEEKPPNLEAKFDKIKALISGETGCPHEAEMTADFFLETPSTTTDTAWLK